MKRALIYIALLAGVLALVLLLFVDRGQTTAVLAVAPREISPSQPEPSAVKLSYVELAASPHRSEQPGATQVYGWVTRGDDGQPVNGGTISLVFEDFAIASGSAAEEHARSDREFDFKQRKIDIQEDGGWFVDLPGKCWIVAVIFHPRADAVSHDFAEFWGSPAEKPLDPLASAIPAPTQNGTLSAMMQFDSPGITIIEGSFDGYSGDLARVPTNLAGAEMRPPAKKPVIRTTVKIEAALEKGALEITFAASMGIEARGVVFDASTSEPLAGAKVVLTSLSSGGLVTGTGPDGGFELYGLDPEELTPENGLVTFVVLAPGHETGMRKVAWERGQACIPAFKVVLEPSSR